jgi:hypothetical protein
MNAAALISLLALTLPQIPLAQVAPISGLPDLSTNKEVKAQVEIKASADTVWRTLTNFPAYDIWNPYIYPASGEAVAGRKLDLTLRGPNKGVGSGTGAPSIPGGGPGSGSGTGSVVHFTPTVLVATPNRELSWGGQAALGGVQRVATFDIEPLGPRRVRLTATERFRGILLPLVSGVTDDSAAGLKNMTNALRGRAELLDFSLPAPAPHR